MASASYAAMGAQAAGTIASAAGKIQGGNAAAALGRAQAADLNVQAGQVQAEGTQEANNQALQTKYLLSNIQGAAAASGGVATSPTVMNLKGRTAARGEYDALSDMYMANERAAGMRYQGALDIYGGQVKQQAAVTSALSTALSGFGGMAAKYGSPGGFSGGGTVDSGTWDT